jgi:aryl-alcohol dehydrogenase-like predicted oxidoreductase
MTYCKLGKTELSVSSLCLGTVQFGTGLAGEDAIRQLDIFTDQGGNFIDTAHVYGDWVPGDTARSERLLGDWIHKKKNREKLVISTKGAHPRLEAMHIPRCTPGDIEKDLNESLKCLGTDYLDMYFLHRDDVSLPAGELISCLESARRQGKIRHYGCSNWTLKRIKEAAAYAKEQGAEGFSCNQLKWSLAEPNAENIPDKSMVLMDGETYAWHRESGISVTAYQAIANGWFSKLYAGSPVSEALKKLYENDVNSRIFKIISRAAAKLSLSITAISLGYILSHPFAAVPIASFTGENQLKEALHLKDTPLPRSLIAELNGCRGF